VVGPIHAKAMPVILTKPEEIEVWMTGPTEEALKLQRPLPDNTLSIIARGGRRDEACLLMINLVGSCDGKEAPWGPHNEAHCG
jgi:hypothetical protein